MPKQMNVDFVAADRQVWRGEAASVMVRTTEGEIGVLPGHAPVIAQLVPCVAEVVTAAGHREIFAVDGGFLSVANDNVSVIAQEIQLSQDISLEEAQNTLDKMHKIVIGGDASDKDWHKYYMANAQVMAAKRTQKKPLDS